MENTILTNLLANSTITGILFFALYKVWNAYLAEKAYNRERDKDNLKLISEMTLIVDGIQKLLATTNIDLSKINDKVVEMHNLTTRINERQMENSAIFQRVNEILADLNMEIRRIGDKSK